MADDCKGGCGSPKPKPDQHKCDGACTSPAAPGGNPRDADLKPAQGIPEDAKGDNPGSMVTGG